MHCLRRLWHAAAPNGRSVVRFVIERDVIHACEVRMKIRICAQYALRYNISYKSCICFVVRLTAEEIIKDFAERRKYILKC